MGQYGPQGTPTGQYAPHMTPTGQYPQQGAQRGISSKPRIDPNQIPSPIAVHEADQELFIAAPFMTMSKSMPPLASSRFCAIDQGSCNPRFIRSTMYSVPTSEEIRKISHIPLGLVVQPLADLDPTEAPIPVSDFRANGPPRCLRCYAYVNAYFRFMDGGRRYLCNMCGHSNEVLPEYFANLDMNGRRIDIDQRPELMFGSYEFEVEKVCCFDAGILCAPTKARQLPFCRRRVV